MTETSGLPEAPAPCEARRPTPGQLATDDGPFLVYCICESESVPARLPSGIDDLPVRVVDGHGLAAIVSPIGGLAPDALSPDVKRVLAYERLIEAVHRLCPVLPMRFGSVVAGRHELLQSLSRHRERYLPALVELRGCVEMGVRVLIPDLQFPSLAATGTMEAKDAGAGAPETVRESLGPGFAYLRARRQHLAAQDRLAQQQEAIAKETRVALCGLFVRQKTELASFHGRRSVAGYFLVQRTYLERFVHASHALRGSHPGTLFVTGPWPPYNFVPTWDPEATS